MIWLRPDEAAVALGVSYANIRVIAHRRKWRTIRIGKDIGYHADDVADEEQRRADKASPNILDASCNVRS